MAAEWPIVRLGDYVDSSLGKMLDAQKNKGLLQPYLGNSNVRWGTFDLSDLSQMRFEEHEEDRYGIRNGDLIVCEGGEPGRAAIWREEAPNMKIQKALHRIRTKDGLNNYYLFYWFMLAARTGRLEPYFTGTTIKHLTGKALSALELPLPPIRVQEEIARILKSLDDKIELNRRMNETLEAMARAIFKSWFVDFDPVRAKASGEPPESICRRLGLTPDLLALFPDRLVDSELGEIPEGWEVWSVSDVGNVVCGKTPPTKTSAYYGDDVPFVTIPDMHGNVFASVTQRKLSYAGAASQPKKTVPAGSICVSCIATPGLVVITTESSQTNQQINSVVPWRQDETYYWFWTFRNLGDEIRAGGSGGSVLTNLSTGRFSKLRILAAAEELRHSYQRYLEPVFGEIRLNCNQTRTLAEIRDTLLPKLLSGELWVPALNSATSEATV